MNSGSHVILCQCRAAQNLAQARRKKPEGRRHRSGQYVQLQLALADFLLSFVSLDPDARVQELRYKT